MGKVIEEWERVFATHIAAHSTGWGRLLLRSSLVVKYERRTSQQ